MQTEEEFQAELKASEDKYFAMRAEKGFPIEPFVKDRTLPSWVQLAGRSFTREWAPLRSKHDNTPIKEFGTQGTYIKTLVAETKRVAKEKAIAEGKPIVQGSGRKGTTAETVRVMIRAAIAANESMESVIKRVTTELMNNNEHKAKRYVTENWARVTQHG